MTPSGASRRVSAVERELDYMRMALAVFAPHGYDSGRLGDYGFADDMRASLARLRAALVEKGLVRDAE